MIIEDVTNFLQKVPPFQFLEEAVLREVAGKLSMEFFPAHTLILTQDGAPSDSLKIIKKGGVKVSMRSEDGEEIVTDYRGEGESFGFLSLIGKDRQRTTITAIDDTICYLLKREEFLKLLEASPAFTEYFLDSHFTKYIHRVYSEMRNRSLYYGVSDRVLFTTQVGAIATKPVVTVTGETAIRAAAQVMSANKISSLVILDRNELPVGIVTDRDLREKVVAEGRDVSDPVTKIMSFPIIGVEARDCCFEVVLKMVRHNIHHITVLKDGQITGVITNHDLMLLQGNCPLAFANDIENQQTTAGLAPVSGKLSRIVGLLLKEGVKASHIARIITELNDRLVRKVLTLAEARYGKPPVPYCWIVFGSEGRKEQTFKTDQDNAIIYADPENPEQAKEAEQFFPPFTLFVRESLSTCGFPLCPANYMASNLEWCQPLKVWKRYFANWVNTPTAEALLKSLILLDFRPLYGDFRLAAELRQSVGPRLADEHVFLGHVASTIIRNAPPIGFLKSFVVEKNGEHKNELNLKVKGLAPIVDAVRLFSLEKDIAETSTLERLAALRDTHTLVGEYADEIEHAFEFIMLLRVHHQFSQIAAGRAPDNFINPNALSNLERRTMREAFHLMATLQDWIIERYKALM